MCGIAGYLDRSGKRDPGANREILARMTNAIAHRGPDGDGFYADPQSGIGLGHRRLSIIDLSDAGSQPMTSADGRWVISYNGEIYNFEEIRKLLEERAGVVRWTGSSDTEVILEAIAAFGFEKALELANGMFAIAAWDRKERALFLARDRMGEKPVYYGWQGRTFLFASELKAIVQHPEFENRICPQAVSYFLRFGYIPQPYSIYAGLKQLRPGTYLKIDADGPVGKAPDITSYWDLPTPAPEAMNEADATEYLDTLLRDAVRQRMRADVPMGAFLSGGIDSSLIVGMMQAQSAAKVRSYSIGFQENAYNESHFAASVARHIGTAHTEMHVTGQDALDLIPSLPAFFDEPFADQSQIPTYLLCKLTRQHVTVALSGDAGDEIFGGYEHYFDLERRWQRRVKAIAPLRQAAASALINMPEGALQLVSRAASGTVRQNLQTQRARHIGSAIACRTRHELYSVLLERWTSSMLKRPETPKQGIFFDQYDIDEFPDPFLGMMYLDAGSYLPDDILVKVDRAAMAVSLETRVPILDHRVVEFAARLPLDLKRRGATGKWILRRVLDRYVPRELIDRPKQGFGIPIKEWLRGPLKSWGEDVLHSNNPAITDLVDLSGAVTAWKEHQSGTVDHGVRLWAVLMLMEWARVWKPSLN